VKLVSTPQFLVDATQLYDGVAGSTFLHHVLGESPTPWPSVQRDPPILAV
jgi:hypothetical protein